MGGGGILGILGRESNGRGRGCGGTEGREGDTVYIPGRFSESSRPKKRMGVYGEAV